MVLSAYLAFEKENPPDALVRGLAEECENLRKGLVIGCDANVHHTQWGRLENRGTPQGGVLSPLLWRIAVNKLLRILEGKVVAYADDVAIIFNGKYAQTLMTAKTKTLSEWTIENGLGVNPSKTEHVLFTNRYKIPQLNPPILNNCNLS